MDFQLNLQSETVDHAFLADPVVLEPSASVRHAFHRMREQKTGGVLIASDEKLVGIFTERDALRLMAAKADLNESLEKHMAKCPVTVLAATTVGEAIAAMARGGYRRLPIVDEAGRPQKVIKTSGILHYLVGHFPMLIYNLPPTPNHTTQTREGA